MYQLPFGISSPFHIWFFVALIVWIWVVSWVLSFTGADHPSSDRPSLWLATGCTVFLGFVAVVCGPSGAVGYLLDNPGWLAIIFGGYLLLGVLHGVFRWDRLVAARRNKLDDAKDEWLADNNLGIWQESYSADFRTYLSEDMGWCVYRGGSWKLAAIPRLSDYKAQWTGWVFFWVLSLPRYLLGDMLCGLAAAIRRRMTVMLDKWSKWRFKGYDYLD